MPTRVARISSTLVLAACVAAGVPGAVHASGDTELRFLRDGAVVRRLDLEALKRSCAVETVEIDDPYYERRKSYLACPLRTVLELGFGTEPGGAEEIVLRARDGYAKPSTVERLREDGGYLAFADAARTRGSDPGWEPIDRRQVDPGPYYVVWAKEHQRDVHRYPWPYQLVEIERTSLAKEYPHTVPAGVPPGAPAWAGYAIFRGECIACHAINGEGGKIGPDLNVPRSIVEYRPAAQVKAYIRDPGAFRYTSMPAHPHLSAEQLDQLIAYFEAMKTRKHDPGRAP